MSAKMPSLFIVLLVRNGEKAILDWLSWHLALGASRIIVADAGSTDGTRSIIQDLARKWPVELLAPSLQHDLNPQDRRLILTQKALERLHDREGWVLCLDVDEYLCPDDSLTALLERACKSDAIALHWCLFGTGGNRQRPRGHLVATHGWRADHAMAEHKFVRLLVRRSAISEPNRIKDPITLDLPSKSWVNAAGKPWSPDETTEALWKGGRILHYACSDYETPVSSESAAFLRRYFNRNHRRELIGTRYLGPTRLMRNRLCQTLFSSGLLHLKKMVEGRQWVAQPGKETDLALPEEAQRTGFSYRRVFVSDKENLLLSPQAFPPLDTIRVSLLRTRADALLEADKQKDEHRVMICLTQDRYPQLAMFFCADRQPFTFCDVTVLDQYAVVITRATHRDNLMSLPPETGRDGIYYEMLSSMEPQIPILLALPSPDEPQGLSLNGLLAWLSTHPEAQPYDIRRALLLLSKGAARALGERIPSLYPFSGGYWDRK